MRCGAYATEMRFKGTQHDSQFSPCIFKCIFRSLLLRVIILSQIMCYGLKLIFIIDPSKHPVRTAILSKLQRFSSLSIEDGMEEEELPK